MTTVLVHGVPEDLHIWDDLRNDLRDAVALGLPGMGAPLPAGFTATKEEYAGWLVGEIETIAKLGGPVDIVGHDWGGILTLHAVLARPELFRSFVTDAVGFVHPEFVWHPLAKIWQTPGAGEKYMTDLAAKSLEERTAQLRSFGVSANYARHMAQPDPVRDDCILKLYRSSEQLHLDWGTDIQPPKPPGLFIIGANDPFAIPAKATAFAASLGLQTRILPTTGHFWPAQSPGPALELIREFWATRASS